MPHDLRDTSAQLFGFGLNLRIHDVILKLKHTA